MSKRIVVPEGMLEAGFAALSKDEMQGNPPSYGAFLEAALLWLSENPIVPTEEQWKAMNNERQWPDSVGRRQWLVAEWQRRMFLAPEPLLPVAILESARKHIIPDCSAEEVKAFLDEYESMKPRIVTSGTVAPEPEVPEEIADLLVGVHPDVAPIALEAYRRGRESR